GDARRDRRAGAARDRERRDLRARDVEGLGRRLMSSREVPRDAAAEPELRSVRVGSRFDTRDALLNAERQARERGLHDILIVDVDAHHVETESWAEITDYLEDPVIAHLSRAAATAGINAGSPLLAGQIGNQDMSGRLPRSALRSLESVPEGE